MTRAARRAAIERELGVLITRTWVLDGAGSARYGWGGIYPCLTRWLGSTLADVEYRLGLVTP